MEKYKAIELIAAGLPQLIVLHEDDIEYIIINEPGWFKKLLGKKVSIFLKLLEDNRYYRFVFNSKEEALKAYHAVRIHTAVGGNLPPTG